MAFKIIFHPEADKELSSSYAWYENKIEGLGKRFIFLLDKKLNEIAEHPERYPIKKSKYREVKINAFPYVVIYEVLKKQKTILVLFIFHTKRNPGLKFKRK